MAVVGVNEIQTDRAVSGKFREAFTYTRGFRVRCDSMKTSLLEISQAPGVTFGQPHPDDPSCLAMEFDAKPDGDTLLVWKVTIKYTLPPKQERDQEDPKPGTLPTDQWSGSSSVTSVPATQDKDGEPITNSAGVAFGDVEKDQADYSLNLTRAYADLSFDADLRECTNKVNAAAWAGGEKGEWKCQGGRWQKKTENAGGSTFTYYSVDWQFDYREGGWALKLMDVGYVQTVDEQGEPSESGAQFGPIKGQDGKPTKDPVSLNNGVAVPPGTPGFPKVINGGKGAEVYKEVSFDRFGSPS